MRNIFIYKKPITLQKSRQFPVRFLYKKHDTLCYRIFHENVEVCIFIQDAWHFALCDVFIYKSRDTSQKSRQCMLCFYIKNMDNLCYTFFCWIFEIGGGGRDIFISKNSGPSVIFTYIKNALCVTFLHSKIQTLCVTFLDAKNDALCVTFLYLKFIVYSWPEWIFSVMRWELGVNL